jgi:hypothetical protein
MKKYFMIFGLALVAGIGVFALTDSMAGTDLLASVVPSMDCGCETCGAECDCSGDKICGDSACGCSKGTTVAVVEESCSGSCSGGSSCGAVTGGSCAAKLESSLDFDGTELKEAGCGCSKHSRS